MTEDERILVKAASFLLGYPDAGWMDSLGPMKGILDDLPGSDSGKGLREVASRLSSTPLLQLQEEYTQLFDLNPSTCLNLTYHKWGDRKERGDALAQLKSFYNRAGFSLTGSELPDYLPLVLEFLSASPDDGFLSTFQEYRDALVGLAGRLESSGSIYAHCLRTVLDVIEKGEPGNDRHAPHPDDAVHGGAR